MGVTEAEMMVSMHEVAIWAIGLGVAVIAFFLRRTLDHIEKSLSILSEKVEGYGVDRQAIETIRGEMLEDRQERHKIKNDLQSMLLFRARIDERIVQFDKMGLESRISKLEVKKAED